MKVYFDTNVLIAALQPSHVHHDASFAAYQKVRRGAIEGFYSGQGLSELYSVLTRAPFQLPVSAETAQEVIEQSIVPHFALADVTVESYRAAIAACARAGRKGGQVHDSVHVHAAAQAGCDLIYTFDIEHLRSLAPEWDERIQAPPPA